MNYDKMTTEELMVQLLLVKKAVEEATGVDVFSDNGGYTLIHAIKIGATPLSGKLGTDAVLDGLNVELKTIQARTGPNGTVKENGEFYAASVTINDVKGTEDKLLKIAKDNDMASVLAHDKGVPVYEVRVKISVWVEAIKQQMASSKGKATTNVSVPIQKLIEMGAEITKY
jgi:hypothetical protein